MIDLQSTPPHTELSLLPSCSASVWNKNYLKLKLNENVSLEMSSRQLAAMDSVPSLELSGILTAFVARRNTLVREILELWSPSRPKTPKKCPLKCEIALKLYPKREHSRLLHCKIQHGKRYVTRFFPELNHGNKIITKDTTTKFCRFHGTSSFLLFLEVLITCSSKGFPAGS